MVVRLAIAVAVLVGGVADLRAQAHGAQAASPAAGHAAGKNVPSNDVPSKDTAAAGARTTAPAPVPTKAPAPAKGAHGAADAKTKGADASAADDHAADASAAAADGHGDAHAPAKEKPKPKVSTVSARPLPPPPPLAAHAAGDHGTTGYVATGSKKASAAAKKSKPVVSAGASVAPKPSDADHETHADSAAPESPHASDAHGAPAAASAGAPASVGDAPPMSGGDVRKPVKLSDVHERLTSALAGFHADARERDGSAKAAPGGGEPSASAAPASRRRSDGTSVGPRVSVQWPGPRWTVAWPGPPRVTLTWPHTSAAAASARQADPH